MKSCTWNGQSSTSSVAFCPNSKTGKKAIVLNAAALAVIAALPRAGAFVIAGDDPEKPRTT